MFLFRKKGVADVQFGGRLEKSARGAVVPCFDRFAHVLDKLWKFIPGTAPIEMVFSVFDTQPPKYGISRRGVVHR